MEAMQKIGQDGLAQGSVESVVIHYPVLTTDFSNFSCIFLYSNNFGEVLRNDNSGNKNESHGHENFIRQKVSENQS